MQTCLHVRVYIQYILLYYNQVELSPVCETMCLPDIFSKHDTPNRASYIDPQAETHKSAHTKRAKTDPG